MRLEVRGTKYEVRGRKYEARSTRDEERGTRQEDQMRGEKFKVMDISLKSKDYAGFKSSI
jgi:hypothetical protein